MAEEFSDPCGQVAVYAVHVAGSSHNGTHVLVAVLDALLHLSQTHIQSTHQTKMGNVLSTMLRPNHFNTSLALLALLKSSGEKTLLP